MERELTYMLFAFVSISSSFLFVAATKQFPAVYICKLYVRRWQGVRRHSPPPPPLSFEAFRDHDGVNMKLFAKHHARIRTKPGEIGIPERKTKSWCSHFYFNFLWTLVPWRCNITHCFLQCCSCRLCLFIFIKQTLTLFQRRNTKTTMFLKNLLLWKQVSYVILLYWSGSDGQGRRRSRRRLSLVVRRQLPSLSLGLQWQNGQT